MATVKYDLIDGTTMELGEGGIATAVRRCIVTDVDIPQDGDPVALYRAIQQAAGMPQFGEPHPVDAGCLLQRHIVRGVSGSGFLVDLVYERPAASGAGGTPPTPPVQGYFVVTRSSTLTTYTRNECPTTDELLIFKPSRKLLEVSYAAPQSQIVVRGLVPYSANVTASGGIHIAGSAYLDAMEQRVGHVNADWWCSRPIGEWLCTSFSTNVEAAGQSLSVEVTFSTNPGGWTIYGVEKDSSGRALREPEDLNMALSEFVKSGYRQGVRIKNGVMAVGMYYTSDFEKVFGFGGDIK